MPVNNCINECLASVIVTGRVDSFDLWIVCFGGSEGGRSVLEFKSANIYICIILQVSL